MTFCDVIITYSQAYSPLFHSCDQIWRNSKVLSKILRYYYLAFGVFRPTLANIYVGPRFYISNECSDFWVPGYLSGIPLDSEQKSAVRWAVCLSLGEDITFLARVKHLHSRTFRRGQDQDRKHKY